MNYIFTIIGFVSVLYVGNDFAGNTFQWEFYENNKEMIKATIYFLAFIAALFGYNIKSNNKNYGYAIFSGIVSIWLTTFIKANFLIRVGINHPYELTIVQLIVVIAVVFLTYKKINKAIDVVDIGISGNDVLTSNNVCKTDNTSKTNVYKSNNLLAILNSNPQYWFIVVFIVFILFVILKSI